MDKTTLFVTVINSQLKFVDNVHHQNDFHALMCSVTYICSNTYIHLAFHSIWKICKQFLLLKLSGKFARPFPFFLIIWKVYLKLHVFCSIWMVPHWIRLTNLVLDQYFNANLDRQSQYYIWHLLPVLYLAYTHSNISGRNYQYCICQIYPVFYLADIPSILSGKYFQYHIQQIFLV